MRQGCSRNHTDVALRRLARREMADELPEWNNSKWTSQDQPGSELSGAHDGGQSTTSIRARNGHIYRKPTCLRNNELMALQIRRRGTDNHLWRIRANVTSAISGSQTGRGIQAACRESSSEINHSYDDHMSRTPMHPIRESVTINRLYVKDATATPMRTRQRFLRIGSNNTNIGALSKGNGVIFGDTSRSDMSPEPRGAASKST